MSDLRDPAARRARRLLRWYPAGWRERYGEEFALLLIDDIAERPRSLARTADVLRSGLRVRLAAAGLTGEIADPHRRMRAGLGSLGLASAAFLTLGIALWSQLTIGWQWSAPADRGTRAAMDLMSGALLGFLVLAVASALPLAWALCAGLRRRALRPPALAALLAAVGLATLVLGSLHFSHGWPGTGGRPWAGRGLVPTGPARLCWAITLWISAYWAHPGALSAFPGAELAWMAVSPVALLATVAGAAGVLRGAPLSPRLLRYEGRLGIACALLMSVMLAGAGSWVVSGGAAPRGLFRAGAIDGAALAVMTAGLVLAVGAVRRTLHAGRAWRAAGGSTGGV